MVLIQVYADGVNSLLSGLHSYIWLLYFANCIHESTFSIINNRKLGHPLKLSLNGIKIHAQFKIHSTLHLWHYLHS